MQLTEVAESLGEEVQRDALEAALDRLVALDERQARIVDMRFLAGLTGEQIAAGDRALHRHRAARVADGARLAAAGAGGGLRSRRSTIPA